MATRKSTPKYEVVTNGKSVILTGVSKTEATKLAGKMNIRGRAKSVWVQPVIRRLAFA